MKFALFSKLDRMRPAKPAGSQVLIMVTEIAESIIVAAVFKGGRITPRAFLWRGRRYNVDKVLGHYHYFKGVWRQDCYSLDCGTPDVFEVAFDTEDMSWRLERVHTEG